MPRTEPRMQLEPPPARQEEYEPVSPRSGGTSARQARRRGAGAPASGPRQLDGSVTESPGRRHTMRRAAISRACAIAAPLAVFLVALMTGEAAAGEFRV